MTIKNIMQCTSLGGTEQSALNQMIGLQRQGHTCHVVSVNPLGDLAPLLEKKNIDAVGCSYRGTFGWRSHLKLRRLIRSRPADATLMTGPTLTGILALRRKNRDRQVLAVHFHHEGGKPKWQWRFLYRFAMRKFKAIIFPSDFVREEAESIYPPLHAVTETVRNPIRMPTDVGQAGKTEARRRLGLPREVPIIGNAGRLVKNKRLDIFLRTAQQVLETQPNAVFVVAGDGPRRNELQQLSKDFGIEDSVRWLGWKKDLDSFYRSLDVLLFNSDREALGMTPIEAMSYATPVVASVKNGGLSEVISCSELGYLFQDHDPNTLAQTIGEMVDDPAQARLLGRSGRAHVAELCSMSRCAQELEELLIS